MELPVLLGTIEVSMFILMPAFGFIFASETFKSYLEWRKTKKPRYFSGVIILGALSLMLMISIFPLFVSRILDFFSWNSGKFYSLLLFLVLGVFLGYWTLPKMLAYSHKLKENQTPLHFTGLIFFGFPSFYALSIPFIPVLHSAFSVAR